MPKKAPSKQYDTISPQLEVIIDKSMEKGKSGLLFDISIENMSMIISSLGSDSADEFIENLTKDLAKLVQKGNVVKRTNSNHIHMTAKNCKPDKAESKSEEIYEYIKNYGSINSAEPVQLSAKIGSVDFPLSTSSAADAVSKAYVALDDARKKHKHFAHFDMSNKHEIESRNQMILASYLQNAFLNNKLRLAFQPIVNSKTGEVGYYESLLRIINEDGSASSAGPFIPIAEKMGFMDVIDSVVLKMVVDELNKSKDVCLSLNLSNASMHDSKWLDMAIKLLADKKVASRLIVEITETAEQHDMKIVAHFANTLRELGCQIALDDFGTGYTSFNQLKKLPVDIIKIDGTFIKDITTNDENLFFVKTLMEFSKNFGLETVAEFVENQDTANLLSDMGVDFLQGNYFSPAVNYRDWMGE